jgi:hypothetical protein
MMRSRWGRGRWEEEGKLRIEGQRYMQRDRVRVGQKGHTVRDSSLLDEVAASGTSDSEACCIDCVKVRRALERNKENMTVKGGHDEKERGGEQRTAISLVSNYLIW